MTPTQYLSAVGDLDKLVSEVYLKANALKHDMDSWGSHHGLADFTAEQGKLYKAITSTGGKRKILYWFGTEKPSEVKKGDVLAFLAKTKAAAGVRIKSSESLTQKDSLNIPIKQPKGHKRLVLEIADKKDLTEKDLVDDSTKRTHAKRVPPAKNGNRKVC